MPCVLHTRRSSLVGLEDLWGCHLQLRAEYPVPEPTANTKAILVIGEVVLEVVLLQLPPISRQSAVVQEVVCHIVAHIPKYTAAVCDQCSVPVVEEDEVGEPPERCCKGHKERRWHDETIFVHWKVMMNTVEDEVQRDAHTIVGEVAGAS